MSENQSTVFKDISSKKVFLNYFLAFLLQGSTLEQGLKSFIILSKLAVESVKNLIKRENCCNTDCVYYFFWLLGTLKICNNIST